MEFQIPVMKTASTVDLILVTSLESAAGSAAAVSRAGRGREPHDNLKTNNLPFHMY